MAILEAPEMVGITAGRHARRARTAESARRARCMRDLHTEHDGVIGSLRMWGELRYAGERWVATGWLACALGRLARCAAAVALVAESFRSTPGLDTEPFGTEEKKGEEKKGEEKKGEEKKGEEKKGVRNHFPP